MPNKQPGHIKLIDIQGNLQSWASQINVENVFKKTFLICSLKKQVCLHL